MSGVHVGEPYVVRRVSSAPPHYVVEPPPLPAVGSLDGLSDVDGAAAAPAGDVLVKDPDGVWRPSVMSGVSGGASYRHAQLSADEVWHVHHTLGFFPGGITAYDSINDIIEPAAIVHVDEDNTDLFFTGRPMSGYVDLS